jgi:hypothetical protein
MFSILALGLVALSLGAVPLWGAVFSPGPGLSLVSGLFLGPGLFCKPSLPLPARSTLRKPGLPVRGQAIADETNLVWDRPPKLGQAILAHGKLPSNGKRHQIQNVISLLSATNHYLTLAIPKPVPYDGKGCLNTCLSRNSIELARRFGLVLNTSFHVAETGSVQDHPYIPIIHGELSRGIQRSHQCLRVHHIELC